MHGNIAHSFGQRCRTASGRGNGSKVRQSKSSHLAAVEQIKGFGIVEWTETSRTGRRILVVSYCPFSGRAAVCVHAYYFDSQEWRLFWDTLLNGTHRLSVELPIDQDVLRCRGADGSVIHTEPLDKLSKFHGQKHLEQSRTKAYEGKCMRRGSS